MAYRYTYSLCKVPITKRKIGRSDHNGYHLCSCRGVMADLYEVQDELHLPGVVQVSHYRTHVAYRLFVQEASSSGQKFPYSRSYQ